VVGWNSPVALIPLPMQVRARPEQLNTNNRATLRWAEPKLQDALAFRLGRDAEKEVQRSYDADRRDRGNRFDGAWDYWSQDDAEYLRTWDEFGM